MATYPQKQSGTFRSLWLAGMVTQMIASGLAVAGGAVLIISDLADDTDKFHGLLAAVGGVIAAIGIVVGLWCFAAISVAKSSRTGGAVMGAIVPSAAILLTGGFDPVAIGVLAAVLLSWYGVSAGFVSEGD